MAHPCQQLVFSDYSIVVILGDHELVSEYGVGHSRVFFGEMSSQDLPKFFSVLSFNSQSADSFLIYLLLLFWIKALSLYIYTYIFNVDRFVFFFFSVVLGVGCCKGAFSSYGKRRLL